MLNERTADDERVTCQLLRETAGASQSVGGLVARIEASYCGRGEPIPTVVRESLAGVLLRLARTLNLAILSLD